MPDTIPGLVPQLTCGDILLASSFKDLLNTASSSLFSFFHSSISLSIFSIFGLFLRYSNVVSSGLIIPALAPPSIDILHIVILCSIDRLEIASPLYSITCPVAPAVPIFPIILRIISLAVTPLGLIPSTFTSKVFGLTCHKHCVARTCSTSLVPIPNAKDPKAPCVEVWLSPQTIVIPGFVRPCSGPIT